MKEKLKTFQLTLTITYKPNGVPDDQLKGMTGAIAEFAANEGLMTLDTEAEVDTWDSTVKQIKK